jgi:hypothetical protein
MTWKAAGLESPGVESPSKKISSGMSSLVPSNQNGMARPSWRLRLPLVPSAVR